MVNERRFAIVLGINDYETNPLNYCVSDAESVRQKLIERCNFKEEDVYLLISSTTNSEREMTGKYKESLRLINQKFTPGRDSILFFFAGHGFYKEEKSIILFHDSEYPIIEIFQDISQLQPKVQFYIIDSCQSGGKVLTRGEQGILSQEFLLEKYIENSEGSMLLYACGSNQSARETSEIGHGLLTYELLKAIDNEELYDEDGFLTPTRIQDYVQTHTTKDSNFEQIPVVENRISGMYPFAILKKPTVEPTRDITVAPNEETIRLLYNKEKRLELQEFICQRVFKNLNDTLEHFNSDYKKLTFENINELNLEGKDKIIEGLVVGARKKGISPIGNIFTTTKRANPNLLSQKLSASLSLFKAFEPKDIPEYIIEHEIDTTNEYIESKFEILISKDIYSVSFGCGIVVYQSKWGLVLTTLIFKIEWDGEKDNIIDTVLQKDYPFLIQRSSYESVDGLELTEFTDINKVISKWNIERKNEIDSFIKTTVSPS